MIVRELELDLDAFEGPFDLLLHLILREQVDLYEVSLTRIVDVYLRELDTMEHLNLEVATEFLLIAATLVELKSRRLLPGEDGLDLDVFIADIERDLIHRSLERTGGNKGQAARLLNLKRTTLVEKLKRLGRQ